MCVCVFMNVFVTHMNTMKKTLLQSLVLLVVGDVDRGVDIVSK